ncbi:GNAT family N-acetyltransferase [Streptosporangium sp. NPDC000396]|uniref:GNAT family N-acetyltransferase n=1 Tax=Streptosporangium sp. NPDC000396 TaxID=3366185 RepID=UPI0036B614AB
MRHFPLLGLRLTTPRLELRLPSFEDLDELADRAVEGIHDPDSMPFGVEWTDVPAGELPGNVVRFNLGLIAAWRPEDWHCNFMVVYEGRVVGVQELSARDFAVTREVTTGSWLGRAYQGRGIGTEIRAAVLHLAFAGLAAESATSGAFLHNSASLSVSRKLGYRPDGLSVQNSRGERAVQQRLRLDRDDFVSLVPVEIHGLDACRSLMGA